MFDINNSQFSYYFGKQPFSEFSSHNTFHEFFISTAKHTSISISKDEKVAVIGLCVDSQSEIQRFEIPNYLSQYVGRVHGLISAFKRLAGVYVIIVHINNEIFVFNDAAGYMQINYHRFIKCFASSEKLLGLAHNLQVSEVSQVVRDGSDRSQPLPASMTMYSEVKALLPNHFLNVSTNTAHRYFTGSEIGSKSDIDSISSFTLMRVENIINEYSKYYHLLCPLTGGTDSRLNLAFLRDFNPSIKAYTLWHKEFTEHTGDVAIPKRISADFGIRHDFVDDKTAPEECVEYVNRYCGDWHSRYTIDLGFTLSEYLQKDEAIINGDIIDQIGKSLIGNAVPDVFAFPSYFLCKIHNFSKEARPQIEEWMAGVSDTADFHTSVFDLFAWENRLGRWASQGHVIYCALSIPSLNIYNCRDIIESWIKLTRRDRSNLVLHNALFNMIDAKYLKYPFNPGVPLTNLLKKHWIPFLFATYGKFYLQKLKGLKKNMR